MPSETTFTAFGRSVIQRYQTIQKKDQWRANHGLKFSDLSEEGQDKYATAICFDSSLFSLRQSKNKPTVLQALRLLNPNIGYWGYPSNARVDGDIKRKSKGFSNGNFSNRWKEQQISSIIFGLCYRKSGEEDTISNLLRKMEYAECEINTQNISSELLPNRIEEEQNIKLNN